MNVLTSLEEALEHYGTNLYRLALLLSTTQVAAVALLRQTVSRLQKRPYQSLSEEQVLQALIAQAAINHQLNRRRLPEWVHHASIPSQIELRSTLAHLELNQRLALGLVHLYDFDSKQVAQVMNIEPTGVRQHISDALLALAPHADLDIPTELLTTEATSIPCRLTRGLLRLGSDLAQSEPQTRGHLALCAECRSIEQAWQQLHHTAGQTVRDALRPHVLSSAQIAEISQPNRLKHNPLGEQFNRILFIALLVVLVIALLVLPGRRAPMPMPLRSASEISQPILPLDIIEQALNNLYEPPDRKGAWHGRWKIQWRLNNGQRAPIIAERWIDYESRRHRVQLTHQDGGAPYELELVDAHQKLWYAISRKYAPSIYPTSLPLDTVRIARPIESEQIDAFLEARLNSGAWRLAAEYLEQARTAPTLKPWGRQRTPDGRLLEILSYEGVSPLAPTSPDMLPIPTLILLFFDSERNTLTEVRELIGPAEGERSVHTTWQYLGDQQLTTDEAINAPLMPRYAWQGLDEPDTLEGHAIDPKLPLIDQTHTRPLLNTMMSNPLFGLATAPPPSTQQVFLIETAQNMLSSVYIGEDWLIALQHTTQPWQSSVQLNMQHGESVDQSVRIHLANQPNDISTAQYIGPYNQIIDIQASAINYGLNDLHSLLASIGTMTLDSYQAHAPLMVEPHQNDPAVVERLLNAFLLPTLPENGNALRVTAQVFSRQIRRADPFPDPYHLPPYGGRPETMQTEVWYRLHDAHIERSIIQLGDDGTIYSHTSSDTRATAPNASTPFHIGLNGEWSYEQTVIYDLLVGGIEHTSEAPDGSLTVISRRPIDESRYAILRHSQLNQNGINGPYVMDMPNISMITARLSLGKDARVQRIELWAEQGDGSPNVLLESWERLREEQVAAATIPADIFPELSPPQHAQPSTETRYAPLSPNYGPISIPFTEALQLQQTPLWLLPPEHAQLIDIEAHDPTHLKSRGQGNVLQSAVEEGYALHFTYRFVGDNQQHYHAQLYQGEVEAFGAYLRTWNISSAGWRSSRAVTLKLDARQVRAWEMTNLNGTTWTFAELDGTLLAIETTRDYQRALIRHLQPYTP